jgi:hypothetical protein
VVGDAGTVAGHRHIVFEAFEHVEGVLRNLDVLFQAELDPGVDHGKGGGGPGICQITFNDGHLQSRIFLGQIKGGGGTHDPATDNNDVITLLAVHGLAFSLSVA